MHVTVVYIITREMPILASSNSDVKIPHFAVMGRRAGLSRFVNPRTGLSVRSVTIPRGQYHRVFATHALHEMMLDGDQHGTSVHTYYSCDTIGYYDY